MSIVLTNNSQVQAFAIALFGVELGSTYMGYVNSDINYYGGLNGALNTYFTVNFAHTSPTAVATTILQNLGLATDAGDVSLVANVISHAPNGQQGAAVMNMLNAFMTNSVYASIAAPFVSSVNASLSYSGSDNQVAGYTATLAQSALQSNASTSALQSSYASNSATTASDATRASSTLASANAALTTAVMDPMNTLALASQAYTDAQTAQTAAQSALNAANTEKTDATNTLAIANSILSAANASTTLPAQAISVANSQVSAANAQVANATNDVNTASSALTAANSQLSAATLALSAFSSFTTGTDVITASGTHNVFTGSVDTSNPAKNTFNVSDILMGGPTDTLNVSANDDITAAANGASIKGLGLINWNLSALTTPLGGTTWDVALGGVDKGVAMTFANTLSTTAVSKLSLSNDKGGARTVGATFSNVIDDATADTSFTLNSTGPNTLVMSNASASLGDGNVSVVSAGDITLDESASINKSGGLVQITSAGAATLNSPKAAAAIVNATGNITIANLHGASSATLVSSTGKITETANASNLDTSTKITATAAKTVQINDTALVSLTLSATGTALLASTVVAGSAFTTASLSGNASGLYVDMSAAGNAQLSTLNVSGTQPVTALLSANSLALDGSANPISINRSGTATFGIDLKSSPTAAGTIDLSAASINNLNLTTDLGSTAQVNLKLANAQLVTDSFAGSFGTNAVTLTGPSTSSTATFVVNNGVNTPSSVSLSVVRIGTLSIDLSKDKNADGSAITETLNGITDNANPGNVSVSQGSNNAVITAASLLMTNTLSVTGSGSLSADASNAMLMGTLDASAVTGAVTVGSALHPVAFDAATPTVGISTLLTGSGNDTLYLGSDRYGGFSVNAGAGLNTVYLEGNLQYNNVSINGGSDGNNILFIAGGVSLQAGSMASSTKTITLTNFATLSYDSSSTPYFTIDSNLLDAKTYSLCDKGLMGETITVSPVAGASSVNLSTLTTTSANAAGVSNDTFVVNPSATMTSITSPTVAKLEVDSDALTASGTLTLLGSSTALIDAGNAMLLGTLSAGTYTGAITVGSALHPVSFDASSNPTMGISSITTGAGNDSIYVGSDAYAGITVNAGLGTNTVYIQGNLGANNDVINAGSGVGNVLFVADGKSLNQAPTKSISLSNFTYLEYSSATGGKSFTIDSNLLSAQTYSLKDLGSMGETINVTPVSSATSIDLRTLTVTSANQANVALDNFSVDATSAPSLTSVQGPLVSAFNFVGSTATAATVVANDAIGDTFTLKAGLGTVSGGTGKNTYNLVAATTSTPSTKYVNITNFQVENSSGKVDTLLLSGHAARLESSYLTSAAGLTGWSVSHGVASKLGATLSDFISAITTTISDAGQTAPVAYDVYVASIGSHVYVADLNASGTAIAHMVQLTGLASSSGLGAEIGVATTTGYIEIQ